MSKKKPRHSSGSSMSSYLGPGKELIQTEVPTLRAVLRKAILIQEEHMFQEGGDRRNLPVKEMIEQVVPFVIGQWHLANSKFIPPVIIENRFLKIKLVEAWEKIRMIALGKASKSVQENW